MKIALVSYGPLGDILPFLALAKKLQLAGHQVRMCSHDIFEDRFKNIGIDYIAIGHPFDKAYYDETLDLLLKIKNPLKSLTFLIERGILKDAYKWYFDALQAIKGWDLAIIHAVDIPAQEAAIKNNIPYVTVSLCPGEIQTCFEPPIPFPDWGKKFNQCFWKITRYLCYKYNRLFNEFIRSIDGKERKNIALEGTYSPSLDLIAASKFLCNEYPDRPEHFKFTGPWLLEEEHYSPPSELVNFLENGEKPIVITFSSIGGTKGIEIGNLLHKVISKTGKRAIIQKGWINLSSFQTNKNIIFVDYVPHSFLFNNAEFIIHHGGAGTTQAACLAGKPSLVIPFLADEVYWGTLIEKKELGPKMLPIQQLNEKNLSDRIHCMALNNKYKKNAEELSLKMRQENGVEKALFYIEQLNK